MLWAPACAHDWAFEPSFTNSTIFPISSHFPYQLLGQQTPPNTTPINPATIPNHVNDCLPRNLEEPRARGPHLPRHSLQNAASAPVNTSSTSTANPWSPLSATNASKTKPPASNSSANPPPSPSPPSSKPTTTLAPSSSSPSA